MSSIKTKKYPRKYIPKGVYDPETKTQKPTPEQIKAWENGDRVRAKLKNLRVKDAERYGRG